MSTYQNTALTASPIRKSITQSNHIFASIIAYVKLEKFKITSKLNHFAMKSKIYIAANREAFAQVINIKNKYVTQTA